MIARYLLRRLTALILSLIAASIVVFLVLSILPGDPAQVILGAQAQPDTLAALRHQLGVDLPWWQRYFHWAGALLHGDLGRSTAYDIPVSTLLMQRIGVTLPLAFLAMAVAAILALPLGMLAARRQGRPTDLGLMGLTQLGVAVPDFWVGLLLILFFAVHLALLPAGGFPGWWHGIGPALKAFVLPTLALALPQAAILTRVTRGAMLDIGRGDYLRTARAKGQSEGRILTRHALPNALGPIITLMGLQFSFLLAGTIVVENVFALPGLGALLFQAIAQRDLVIVQDLVLFFAGLVIVVNAMADLLQAMIDPRLARAAA